MKRNWTCPTCSLVFSRKWNLQRHFKLIHGVNVRPESNYHVSKSNFLKSSSNVPVINQRPSFGLNEGFKEVFDFIEMQDKTVNSRQVFERLNSLQWQVGSLQQQLRSSENRLSDLLSYNWLLPKGAIQGISGYICKRCQTFSLKAIIEIGYDMTMERKHRCVDSQDKRSYVIFPIPSDIQNIDDWAAQILLNHVNFYIPIGKYLIASEATKGLNNFSNRLNPEIAREILGVSDRYYLYPLEKNYKIDWIHRAIDNLGKKIVMSDSEILDFLKRVKSTYAIFEIPIGETVRQILMTLTNY
jgi:hypothetical protein